MSLPRSAAYCGVAAQGASLPPGSHSPGGDFYANAA